MRELCPGTSYVPMIRMYCYKSLRKEVTRNKRSVLGLNYFGITKEKQMSNITKYVLFLLNRNYCLAQ